MFAQSMFGTHEFAAVQITPDILVEFAMLNASLGHALPHLKHQLRRDPLLPKLRKVLRSHHDVQHLPERLFAIWSKWNADCNGKGAVAFRNPADLPGLAAL